MRNVEEERLAVLQWASVALLLVEEDALEEVDGRVVRRWREALRFLDFYRFMNERDETWI